MCICQKDMKRKNNNPLPVLYFLLHGRSGNENIIFDLNMKGIADGNDRKWKNKNHQ